MAVLPSTGSQMSPSADTWESHQTKRSLSLLTSPRRYCELSSVVAWDLLSAGQVLICVAVIAHSQHMADCMCWLVHVLAGACAVVFPLMMKSSRLFCTLYKVLNFCAARELANRLQAVQCLCAPAPSV